MLFVAHANRVGVRCVCAGVYCVLCIVRRSACRDVKPRRRVVVCLSAFLFGVRVRWRTASRKVNINISICRPWVCLSALLLLALLYSSALRQTHLVMNTQVTHRTSRARRRLNYRRRESGPVATAVSGFSVAISGAGTACVGTPHLRAPSCCRLLVGTGARGTVRCCLCPCPISSRAGRTYSRYISLASATHRTHFRCRSTIDMKANPTIDTRPSL